MPFIKLWNENDWMRFYVSFFITKFDGFVFYDKWYDDFVFFDYDKPKVKQHR